jgi:hypothetical protein
MSQIGLRCKTLQRALTEALKTFSKPACLRHHFLFRIIPHKGYSFFARSCATPQESSIASEIISDYHQFHFRFRAQRN